MSLETFRARVKALIHAEQSAEQSTEQNTEQSKCRVSCNEPKQNTLGMFSKKLREAFRRTLFYPITGEWSGQGLGSSWIISGKGKRASEWERKWERRQNGDLLRMNKGLKIVIDTFERYYHNAAVACNSPKYTCAFLFSKKMYYNYLPSSIVYCGLLVKNPVSQICNWGSIPHRVVFLYETVHVKIRFLFFFFLQFTSKEQ